MLRQVETFDTDKELVVHRLPLLYSVYRSELDALVIDCGRVVYDYWGLSFPGVGKINEIRQNVRVVSGVVSSVSVSYVDHGISPLCANCDENLYEHIDGKCLYDFTTFADSGLRDPWHIQDYDRYNEVVKKMQVNYLYLTQEAAGWLITQPKGRILPWPKGLP